SRFKSRVRVDQCPFLEVKRTSLPHRRMFANDPKRTSDRPLTSSIWNASVAFAAHKQPLEFRYCHLGSNRIGNETILVGRMVHFIELFCTGFSVAAPLNSWAYLDPHYRELTVVILLQMANRFVLVGIEHELLLTRNC